MITSGKLSLTKYHGLRNDFLLLVDLKDQSRIDGGLARSLCDRHTGIGADGLIRVGPGRPDADASMELLNADGSHAEISGNGIRCLAHALRDSGIDQTNLRISTDAGIRELEVIPGRDDSILHVRVDMGEIRIADRLPGWTDGLVPGRAAYADLGNPHLVVEGDPETIDLDSLGRRAQELSPVGVNVEVAKLGSANNVVMRVWERGVGETMACGSGAAATAAVFLAWTQGDVALDVDQPGGRARVERTAAGTYALIGPSQRVARIEVDVPMGGVS